MLQCILYNIWITELDYPHDTPPPLSISQDDDDEILCELRRCQSELRAVSQHNATQLTRLLNLARDSLVRHDLKKRLRDADHKVCRVYTNSVCISEIIVGFH